SPSLTASSTGLTSDTQVETITAAGPTRLALITAPQTVTAGSCSGIVTVQSQDALGNPASVTLATVVSLSSSSLAGVFYGTSACGAAVTQVTIAVGASTATFYFGDTK